RLKSCWAIVSNIQPRLATERTNQWYRFRSLYHLYGGSIDGDMKLLFYRRHSIARLHGRLGRHNYDVALGEPFGNLHLRHARDALLHGAPLHDAVLHREDIIAGSIVADTLARNYECPINHGGANFGIHIRPG